MFFLDFIKTKKSRTARAVLETGNAMEMNGLENQGGRLVLELVQHSASVVTDVPQLARNCHTLRKKNGARVKKKTNKFFANIKPFRSLSGHCHKSRAPFECLKEKEEL